MELIVEYVGGAFGPFLCNAPNCEERAAWQIEKAQDGMASWTCGDCLEWTLDALYRGIA